MMMAADHMIWYVVPGNNPFSECHSSSDSGPAAAHPKELLERVVGPSKPTEMRIITNDIDRSMQADLHEVVNDYGEDGKKLVIITPPPLPPAPLR